MPQKNRRAKGTEFEQIAQEFLVKKGYSLVETNYYTAYGEIDLIAYEKDTLCFIEVRSTASRKYGSPLRTISYTKRKRLTQSALLYIQANDIHDVPMRFDVIGIVQQPFAIKLIRNAFMAAH